MAARTIIFSGTIISKGLSGPIWPKIELFPNRFSRTIWICLTGLTLLPTVWLKLQKLTFLSALGSYIMLALVFAVLYAVVSTAPEKLDNNEYKWFNFEIQALRLSFKP